MGKEVVKDPFRELTLMADTPEKQQKSSTPV